MEGMVQSGHLVKIPPSTNRWDLQLYAAPDSEGDAVCPRPSHGHPGPLKPAVVRQQPKKQNKKKATTVPSCAWRYVSVSLLASSQVPARGQARKPHGPTAQQHKAIDIRSGVIH